MTLVRDLQLSMIEGGDYAIGDIPQSVCWGLNADLIHSIAPLYLRGSVLDVTYGQGGWWKRYRPQPFAFHDLKLDGVDFRDLPEQSSSWDAVCFDPPYLPRQGPNEPTRDRERRFRAAYGLDVSRSGVETRELILAGLDECARVARRWLLVKCCDFTNGRQFHLGHQLVLDRGQELGLAVHDLLIHASGSGPGGGQIKEAKRARRAHSYLVVFRKKLSRGRAEREATDVAASAPARPDDAIGAD